MNNVEFYCQSCNANWTKGSYTPGCEECGVGTLTRPCIICDGKCGNAFDRAPLDSNDSGMAHWIGSCGLPKVEQFEIVRRKVKEKIFKFDACWVETYLFQPPLMKSGV